MTGAIAAYMHLAYDLYLIAHNEKLQSRLVERLKNIKQFYGALYEVRVAAAFVRAGFKLEFENEDDGSTSHCEFTATFVASGKKYSVEAKGHEKSDTGRTEKFRWGQRLQKALAKKANHPRIIFLDVNVPDSAADKEVPRFLQKALVHIRRWEDREPRGKPLPPAYVFVTNFPYHHHLEGTTFRASVLAEGFKIPEFKGDAPFPSIHDAVVARENHSEMHQLLAAFIDHTRIPSTFDGEIPEFAEQQSANRLLIGNWYLVPVDGEERPGKLCSATVSESKKSVWGIYELENGKRVIVECPLSDSELRAYREHPDTFFGEVKEVSKQINHPLEAYDWALSVYKDSPKENLLKLMKAEHDDDLKVMSQGQLAKLYSEQIATAMMARTGGVEPNKK